MEKIYVRSNYLKAAHYFFYSMAVFSLIFAITFWESFAIESVMFVVFFIIYITVSLIIAFFFYRDYKKQLEGIVLIKAYAIPYIALSFFIIFATELLSFVSPEFIELVYSALFINYYYVFVIIIGAVLYVLKPVRTLFKFRSRYVLRNAKKIALRYSRLADIKYYKEGTDPLIDDMLDDIWSHRYYPVPQIQKLEIRMCDDHIKTTTQKLKIENAEKKNPDIIERLKKEKERYEKLLEQIRSYRD